jgi:hypothetical protein
MCECLCNQANASARVGCTQDMFGTRQSKLEKFFALVGVVEEKGMARGHVTWLGAVGAPVGLVEAAQVMRGGPFRAVQVLGLHAGDAHKRYVRVENKMYNRNHQEEKDKYQKYSKEVVGAKAWAIMRARAKGKKPEHCLFPCAEFRAAKMNAMVKKCAVVKGWPKLWPDLVFHSHSLRHGGVARLVAEGREGLLPVSGESVKRYGRANAIR